MDISLNNNSLKTSAPDSLSTKNGLPARVVIQLSVHSVVFILGTIGNIFIAAVILRFRSMHSATNWLVFNLTVSDLCLTIVNIPLANIYHFTGWPFGKALCEYFLGAFGECIVGVSVFTHTALSLVRYQVVLNPLKSRIGLRQVCIGIAFIWVFSYALLSAPINGKFHLVYSKKVKGFVCKLEWPSMQYKLVYRGCVFTITYVIPMIIATFCYLKIFSALKRSLKFLADGSSATHAQVRRREYKSKRLTKALYLIYTIFAFTTLPLEIFYVLADARVLPRNNSMAYIWSMLLALFYSLSVVNPIMLFYMSEDYRIQLCHLVGRQRCCVRRKKSSGSSKWTKSSRLESNTQQFTFTNNIRRDSKKSLMKTVKLEDETFEMKEVNRCSNKNIISCHLMAQKAELLKKNKKETLV